MTWQRRFIDGRFQRVYLAPAAVLPAFAFGQQRTKCEACARCTQEVLTPDRSQTVALHCGLQGNKTLSCSTARAADGLCGPNASRFTPASRTST